MRFFSVRIMTTTACVGFISSYVHFFLFHRFDGYAFDVQLFYRYEIPAVCCRRGNKGGRRVKRPKILLRFKPSTRETSAARAGSEHANRWTDVSVAALTSRRRNTRVTATAIAAHTNHLFITTAYHDDIIQVQRWAPSRRQTAATDFCRVGVVYMDELILYENINIDSVDDDIASDTQHCIFNFIRYPGHVFI